MISALILAASLAQGTPLLRSQFDLTSMRGSLSAAEHRSRLRARYLGTTPEWDDGDDDDGIQIKLKATKVKVKVPIPSI